MADTDLDGHCLCGAVRVTVADGGAEPSVLSACHCDPCRRWSGAVLWGFEAEADRVSYRGPARAFRSSDFAQRAWCDECGTQLWFREDDGPYELNPGLFSGARDWPLTREVYADRAAAHVRLAGDHARLTKAEYEAGSPHVADAAMGRGQ